MLLYCSSKPLLDLTVLRKSNANEIREFRGFPTQTNEILFRTKLRVIFAEKRKGYCSTDAKFRAISLGFKGKKVKRFKWESVA